MPAEPLSVDLSRLLLALTIEVDNEFEHRMAAAAPERPFRVSLVMWSNFLRIVGDGIAVGELPAASGLPKARVLSTLGGMERWRYVFVAPRDTLTPPAQRRDGYGSARAVSPDWIVRPTAIGAVAREQWPPVLAEIEARWRSRFGAKEVAALRDACSGLVTEPLPEYLPVVTGTNGLASEVADPTASPSAPAPLSAALAQALLAYTLAFERVAPLSLPLAETVVRALGGGPLDVRDVPAAAAVSPEAVSMALTFLRKRGQVEGEKVVQLTAAGAAASEESRATHPRVEDEWDDAACRRLRDAAQAILDQRDGERSRLALGLEPYPEGWRAGGRYATRTAAMLEDPATGLPRHPVVLHRGGWPDGS